MIETPVNIRAVANVTHVAFTDREKKTHKFPVGTVSFENCLLFLTEPMARDFGNIEEVCLLEAECVCAIIVYNKVVDKGDRVVVMVPRC